MAPLMNTADFLLYSSMYNTLRNCRHIHGDWIVRRALRTGKNPTIVYLPMSNDEEHGQSQLQTSEAFLRLFEQDVPLGLRTKVHFWRHDLSKTEIERIFHDLETCEILILGGGTSELGLARYSGLGNTGYGDPERFRRTLETRHANGKLTVGFSAGAEQLSTSLIGVMEYEGRVKPGFGLVQDVIVAVHFESCRAEVLRRALKLHPRCQIFALPNETGLGIRQRALEDGRVWQLIEFIVDPSARQSMHHIMHMDADGQIRQYPDGVQMERLIDRKNFRQGVKLRAPNRS